MSITLLGAGDMETNEIVPYAKHLKIFLELFTALLLIKLSQTSLNPCMLLASITLVVTQVCGIFGLLINQIRIQSATC